MPKVDYNREYAKRVQLNQERMLSEIKSGAHQIREKIQSRLGMYGLSSSVEEVLDDLQRKVKSGLSDAEIISISEWAAVKPERQNLHEGVALGALQSVYGRKVNKLPTKGKNAVFFSKGAMYSSKPDTDSKSIDFLLLYEDPRKALWKIYIGHKFTQNIGGKQNQQNVQPDRDMRNPPNEQNLLFISTKDGEGAEATLAKSINQYEVTGSIYACRIKDVEEIIIEVCDKQNTMFSFKDRYWLVQYR